MKSILKTTSSNVNSNGVNSSIVNSAKLDDNERKQRIVGYCNGAPVYYTCRRLGMGNLCMSKISNTATRIQARLRMRVISREQEQEREEKTETAGLVFGGMR